MEVAEPVDRAPELFSEFSPASSSETEVLPRASDVLAEPPLMVVPLSSVPILSSPPHMSTTTSIPPAEVPPTSAEMISPPPTTSSEVIPPPPPEAPPTIATPLFTVTSPGRTAFNLSDSEKRAINKKKRKRLVKAHTVQKPTSPTPPPQAPTEPTPPLQTHAEPAPSLQTFAEPSTSEPNFAVPHPPSLSNKRASDAPETSSEHPAKRTKDIGWRPDPEATSKCLRLLLPQSASMFPEKDSDFPFECFNVFNLPADHEHFKNQTESSMLSEALIKQGQAWAALTRLQAIENANERVMEEVTRRLRSQELELAHQHKLLAEWDVQLNRLRTQVKSLEKDLADAKAEAKSSEKSLAEANAEVLSLSN